MPSTAWHKKLLVMQNCMSYSVSMTPLREYRKTHGLTLTELAPRIGVTDGQLSRIEREGTTMLDIALKLSELTKHPPAAFQKREAA